jgi:maleate isomerase
MLDLPIIIMSLHRRQIRLGVIVPSSNTVLEPLTYRIVASLSNEAIDLSVHFSRFRVTKIALSDDANAQFALDAMIAAAQLLADANVDVIGWSGTSASWLGFETDETLCSEIEKQTGIPATTSVLAMNKILSTMSRGSSGSLSIGLVTPYLQDVAAAIQRNYEEAGFPIYSDTCRYAGLSDNFQFAALEESKLDTMVEDVVWNGATSVMIMCTNVAAAHKAKYLETRYNITVLDSVAAVVRGMLEILNLDISSLGDGQADPWGCILRR